MAPITVADSISPRNVIPAPPRRNQSPLLRGFVEATARRTALDVSTTSSMLALKSSLLRSVPPGSFGM